MFLSFHVIFLSISRITKDLDFRAYFSSYDCQFQDLDSRRMISNAKEHCGLYYFEDGQSLRTFVANSFFWFPFQLLGYYVMAFSVRPSQFSLFEKIVPNIIC